MTKENAEKIGNFMGTFIPTNTKGSNSYKMTRFLRVRVAIDIRKPLKTRFFLLRENNTMLWIQFKYERLSDFCYRCGLLGHNENFCRGIKKNTKGVLNPR